MNRDKQGTAITDRAPQDTKQEKTNSQPPSNPSSSKNESNTSTSSRKSLKDIAQDKLNSGNASQLGDPVSMKAETADSQPTDQDRGSKGAPNPENKGSSSSGDSKGSASSGDVASSGQPSRTGKKDESNTSTSSRKSLKEVAEDKLKEGNASQLGDPVSLKAETADSEPTDQDRGSKGAPNPEEKGKKGSKL